LLHFALCPRPFGWRPWCFGRRPRSFGRARPRGTTGGQVNRNRLDVTRVDFRTALCSHPPDRGPPTGEIFCAFQGPRGVVAFGAAPLKSGHASAGTSLIEPLDGSGSNSGRCLRGSFFLVSCLSSLLFGVGELGAPGQNIDGQCEEK
jgi:hypothetical protein